MTTEPQIHQPPLSQLCLWRSRITYTSAQKESIMQNKPNFCRFWAKNGYLEEKQTQFKPNQTQFFASFFLPILPVLSKAEGPIHPIQTQPVVSLPALPALSLSKGVSSKCRTYFNPFPPVLSEAQRSRRACRIAVRS